MEIHFLLGTHQVLQLTTCLYYRQLRERARWIKSCAVIGYPSGQDGATLLARVYPPRPTRKSSRTPHSKSLIDQAFSVKMAGYWPRSFFNMFMDFDLTNIQPSWPHTWSITHISRPSRQYISPSLLTVLLIAAFHFRSPRFVTTSPTKRFTPKKSCTISRASSNQASPGDTLKPTSPSRRAQSPNLSRTLSAAWRDEGAWVCPGVRLPWKALSRIRRVDVIVMSVHDVKKHNLP